MALKGFFKLKENQEVLREGDSVVSYKIGTFEGNMQVMQARCNLHGAGKSCGHACASDINACPVKIINDSMAKLAKENHVDDIQFEPDGKVKTACRYGGVIRRGQYIEYKQGVSQSIDGYMRIPGERINIVARVIHNFTSYDGM